MKTSTLFPKNILAIIWLFTLALFSCTDNEKSISNIPLPEHPRPDFERASWINLNGYWDFEFDGADKGESEKWFDGSKTYSQKILVPFPWGSPLSEVENKDDIALREINRMLRWPAQVHTYKIGANLILRKKLEWEQKYGEDFAMVRFHDIYLKNGSIPLEIIDLIYELEE